MLAWPAKKASNLCNPTQLWVGLLLGLLLSVFLTGCGFHLRGTGAVGQIQATHVVLHEQAGVRPAIIRALSRQLEQAGVKVFTAKQNADSLPAAWRLAQTSTPTQTLWHIRLRATRYEVTSTAQRLGDVTAQLMRMQQPFEVYRLENKATPQPNQSLGRDQAMQETSAQKSSATRLLSATVNAYRDREIQLDAAMASASEKRELQQSMSRELAQKLMNRLRRGITTAPRDSAESPK